MIQNESVDKHKKKLLKKYNFSFRSAKSTVNK